ncbi:hypothetical protein [uncultured Chryseobacterium sp.]|uniref:hypothetical protein n=1 Tax=uncultured Chryseobacterium sp. TaxID=259322 RepID=UPI0025D96E20|nr:hypothetical protein [uncultured Chryseobacterium sp.]
MKTIYKTILVIINLIILVFAIRWYIQSSSTENNEPIIVILGQLLSIITLIVESISSSGVNIKNVKNKSKVQAHAKSGENIKVSGVDDSEVNTTIR